MDSSLFLLFHLHGPVLSLRRLWKRKFQPELVLYCLDSDVKLSCMFLMSTLSFDLFGSSLTDIREMIAVLTKGEKT